MSIDSFVDCSKFIFNAENNLHGRRYDAERYEYFNKGPLLDIRKYLNEKKQMGLLKNVEIMAATISNYYRFCIYSVPPQIWEIEDGQCARVGIRGLKVKTYKKILLPAIKQIVDVVHRITDGSDTVIYVQEKRLCH